MYSILVVIIELFVASTNLNNSIKITHLDGQQLSFSSYSECRNHVEKNIIQILNFSQKYFESELSRFVVCVKNDAKGIDL